MSKVRKIGILVIVNLILWSQVAYAKYRYYFEEVAFELSRDKNAPICKVSYSVEEITNQNVLVTITSNKEMEQVSGFELSSDKKTLTKEVTENENKKVIVRDLSGNCAEVEYNVNNIDKEPPKIIGCEDGKTYDSPVTIDCMDNDEIKEFTIDKYEDTLKMECRKGYDDCFATYGTDRTKSSLTLHIKGHPIGTKKYQYYANNELYTTSTEEEYTFTGLEKGTEYELKVQALDEVGNRLDEAKLTVRTSYYGSIYSNKTQNQWEATIQALDSSVSYIRYAVWNVYEEKNVKWQKADIRNCQAKLQFQAFHKSSYPHYMIHAYLYSQENEILDIVEFSVDLATSYEKKEGTQETMNEIQEPGNYQIKAVDFAGNETIYHIKVE